MHDNTKEIEILREGDQLIMIDHHGRRIPLTPRKPTKGESLAGLAIAAVGGTLIGFLLSLVLSLLH